MKIVRSEPWKMPSRNKGVDNQRQNSKKNKTGGGNNPSRTRMNKNKSGDHLTPDYMNMDRARRSGDSSIDGGVPDLAGHPARKGRNPSGDPRTPRIRRIKSKNSYS